MRINVECVTENHNSIVPEYTFLCKNNTYGPTKSLKHPYCCHIHMFFLPLPSPLNSLSQREKVNKMWIKVQLTLKANHFLPDYQYYKFFRNIYCIGYDGLIDLFSAYDKLSGILCQ